MVTDGFINIFNRVQIAALKLANGDLDRLARAIDAANTDYRDILAWAESPDGMRLHSKNNHMTRKAASRADRQQMQERLSKFADAAQSQQAPPDGDLKH